MLINMYTCERVCIINFDPLPDCTILANYYVISLIDVQY